jgi:alpha-L-fucosidase
MPNNIYPATSPYFNTIVNNKFLDVMNYRPIPKKSSDVYYTITQVYEYRPDLLAFDLYGDSRVWWVFADRNPNRLSKDPYFDFVAGLEIYIPQLSTLQEVLGI